MNYQKNIEILTGLEKVLKEIGEKNGGEKVVDFEIEGSDGNLTKVSKEEFARWMEEGKNIKTPPKESLVFGVSGDIDGLTYFTERKGKDGVIKESYYQPRSEEGKKQIKKRQEINRKRREREQEKSQKEISTIGQDKEAESINLNELAKEMNWGETKTSNSNSDKKDQQKEEKDNNQQNQSQKSTDNKSNNDKKVFYGMGIISLVLLVVSMIAVWVKKKK